MEGYSRSSGSMPGNSGGYPENPGGTPGEAGSYLGNTDVKPENFLASESSGGGVFQTFGQCLAGQRPLPS